MDSYIKYLKRKSEELRSGNPHLKDVDSASLDEQLKMYSQMRDDKLASILGELEKYASRAFKSTGVSHFLTSIRGFANKGLVVVEDMLFGVAKQRAPVSKVFDHETASRAGLVNPAVNFQAVILRRAASRRASTVKVVESRSKLR